MANVIFIHGISKQTTGYSNGFFKKIVRAYKKNMKKKKYSKQTIDDKIASLNQHEILWADTTTDLTNRYEHLQYGVRKRPGKYNPITRAVDPLFIQILSYALEKKSNKKLKIVKKVDEGFQSICLEDKTIVIAHSLGTVISFDYLFGFTDYKMNSKINIDMLITMGSPIPVFTSAMGHPYSELRLPKNVKSWINILDPDDVVAKFCKNHFKNIAIKDEIVNTGFAPLSSHSNYWRSNKVADLIAKKMISCKI